MVFFNLFCIIGIVAFFMIMMAVSKIKRKSVETLEIVQDTALNVNEATGGIIGILTNIFSPRKSFVSYILDVIKRK
jgi:hypothetical protein